MPAGPLITDLSTAGCSCGGNCADCANCPGSGQQQASPILSESALQSTSTGSLGLPDSNTAGTQVTTQARINNTYTYIGPNDPNRCQTGSIFSGLGFQAGGTGIKLNATLLVDGKLVNQTTVCVATYKIISLGFAWPSGAGQHTIKMNFQLAGTDQHYKTLSQTVTTVTSSSGGSGTGPGSCQTGYFYDPNKGGCVRIGSNLLDYFTTKASQASNWTLSKLLSVIEQFITSNPLYAVAIVLAVIVVLRLAKL